MTTLHAASPERPPTANSTATATEAQSTAVAGLAINLNALHKTYGATVAVDRVDLAVAPGEIVALLGPNGAGKSTTVDLLLGLDRPDAGSARIFGLPPATACAKGRVGAMLQSGGLPGETTVGELVHLMRALYPRALPGDEVLTRARIADLAGRRTNELSGGETQRVRFALALVPDPDLLVLDEPTAAMDVETRKTFWESMRRWADGGRTALFATHYLEEADAVADRVVVLCRGRVVADGTTAEVKALAGGRTIRCTLPETAVADPDTATALGSLPGVRGVSVEDRSVGGRAVSLACTDSDLALRALLAGWPGTRDIEVRGAALDDAFLALTATHDEEEIDR
jgi:ABC-2 type transport system ATP-binding protein